MNFGEMYAWTNRFHNIITVGGELKNTRLESLKVDLELATDIESCQFARGIYLRTMEELNGYGN